MKASKYNVFIPLPSKGYILFNTMSKSLFTVDEELKLVLQNEQLQALDSSIITPLEKHGFIIPNGLDELEMFRVKANTLKYRAGEASFIVLPTFACNLACKYCYEGAGKVFSHSMSEEIAEKTLQFIKNKTLSKKSKRFIVGFYGGEPLVKSDVCHYLGSNLSEWAKERGIDYFGTLTTNGTLLTTGILEKLDSSIHSIHFTLDGPRDIHNQKRIYKDGQGTYDKVLDSISLVKDTDKHLAFRLHFEDSPENAVKSITAILDDLESLGIKDRPKSHVYFVQLEPSDSCLSVCYDDEESYLKYRDDALKTLPKLWKLAQQKGWGRNIDSETGHEHSLIQYNFLSCQYLNNGNYVIDPLGDLYLCPVTAGFKEHRIGTVTDEDPNKYLSSYYQILTKDSSFASPCSDCEYLPICGGGCPVSASVATGSYQGNYCGLTKRILEKSLALQMHYKYPERFDE